MNFLSDFVMVALIVQVAALALCGIIMGTQALQRSAMGVWQRVRGATPNPGH